MVGVAAATAAVADAVADLINAGMDGSQACQPPPLIRPDNGH